MGDVCEIREKSRVLYEHVSSGKSKHWKLNKDNMENVKEHILKLIQRDYNNNLSLIPPHSRLRHHPQINEFIEKLKSKTQNADDEKVKRKVLDMLIMSCLLDAGAGDQWSYRIEGRVIGRSEGIAQAVQDMYLSGKFDDLSKLTMDDLIKGFQVSVDNPMNGLENRLLILEKLSKELKSNPIFSSTKRPSAFIDYLHENDNNVLWSEVVMNGFARVYPKGDEWLHEELNVRVPFYKLQQWLTYTLLDALNTYFPELIVDIPLLTGLPEYRNGGLFIDHQVLTPLQSFKEKAFDLEDDLVIEWRACTVILCDELLEMIRVQYKDMQLAQLLEAGTWKAGREMAALIRPTTKSSPIPLNLDGIIF